MSSRILSSTPRRGTLRASHLRQVSSGSLDSTSSKGNSRPPSISSDTGTAHYVPDAPKAPVERRCNLWVHDDGFSKDEVVLNMDLFPEVQPGDLLAIIGLKTDSGVRDFQESNLPKKDAENLGTTMHRERSKSTPKSPVLPDTKYDSQLGKRYLFCAKDLPKELKLKNPTLEVSIHKQLADVFNFKHRSNVLITTVRLYFTCFK